MSEKLVKYIKCRLLYQMRTWNTNQGIKPNIYVVMYACKQQHILPHNTGCIKVQMLCNPGPQTCWLTGLGLSCISASPVYPRSEVIRVAEISSHNLKQTNSNQTRWIPWKCCIFPKKSKWDCNFMGVWECNNLHNFAHKLSDNTFSIEE